MLNNSAEAQKQTAIRGNSTQKNYFTYSLGFGLVSGVAKVFPVSSLSLARKSTRKKRARRARMTKWDPKSRDRLLVGPDRTWAIARELAGACYRSSDCESRRWPTRETSRIAMRFGQLLRNRPRQVQPGHETVTRLGIPIRHAGSSATAHRGGHRHQATQTNPQPPTGDTRYGLSSLIFFFTLR